eukprot:CAMPEP_0184485804 /NCGR_PEP_ID=MMETSP0113_2-20130426/7399_1 /TAXON_ID=91329 /ORGANISM="Norrisiella sphaerica, Strain BC52" /LENGTH=175 /DNA_ID=CAMNT_0026867427 /DNA_START=104 /DNA_END=631 /DNA_ORIENTATION=-
MSTILKKEFFLKADGSNLVQWNIKFTAKVMHLKHEQIFNIDIPTQGDDENQMVNVLLDPKHRALVANMAKQKVPPPSDDDETRDKRQHCWSHFANSLDEIILTEFKGRSDDVRVCCAIVMTKCDHKTSSLDAGLTVGNLLNKIGNCHVDQFKDLDALAAAMRLDVSTLQSRVTRP